MENDKSEISNICKRSFVILSFLIILAFIYLVHLGKEFTTLISFGFMVVIIMFFWYLICRPKKGIINTKIGIGDYYLIHEENYTSPDITISATSTAQNPASQLPATRTVGSIKIPQLPVINKVEINVVGDFNITNSSSINIQAMPVERNKEKKTEGDEQNESK